MLMVRASVEYNSNGKRASAPSKARRKVGLYVAWLVAVLMLVAASNPLMVQRATDYKRENDSLIFFSFVMAGGNRTFLNTSQQPL